MALSILHRATGIANAAGLVVFTAWLVQAAAGPEQYLAFTRVLASPIGLLLLLGWTFSFFYHLANGIRHLVWDAGYGLDKAQLNRGAWTVIAAAVLLTAGFWLVML